MKHFKNGQLLTALAVLLSGALASCDPVDPEEEPTERPTATATEELETEETYTCLDFEDLALGTTYTPGDIFMTAGLKVYVRQFMWDNGTLTPSGQAEVQNGGLAGGSGNELAVNNVNVAFEFPSTIHEFTLLFGEYGGNLNIEINGDFLNFEDFKEIDGMNIGGVDVTVPVGGLGNDMGVLKLKGPIDVLMIGGQELWIDHRCEPISDACIDFENLTAGTTFNVGDLFSSGGAIIEVWDFTWSDGTVTTTGHALVDNAGMAGGSGNEVNANNVNLYFDFGGLLTGLTLHYGDHGGNLNIEINGDFVNFGTFADINGSTIGGVSVVATPSGTGGLGTLSLNGEIELFALGGQELWIDDVCPRFKGESVTFRCADFNNYPDDTKMPQVSTINGFTITALGPDAPFVNDIDTSVHGLQFDPAGLQIDLLAPAHTVTMTVGSWTSEPLKITALDANGNQVDQVTVPGDNSAHTITLSGQNITQIVITGGGYEGILVELCYYPG